MMAAHDREMTLADGREVLVDYEVESYGSEPSGMHGPPENYDPGSGPDLSITRVRLADDAAPNDPIELDDVERYRLENIIAENPDWWMPDDDYYDDHRNYDDD